MQSERVFVISSCVRIKGEDFARVKLVLPTISAVVSIDHFKVVPLLQFFVYASVISYVAFLLS